MMKFHEFRSPMQVVTLVFAVMAAACCVDKCLAQETSTSDAGWKSLFDGKTLKGWGRHNGTASYEVKDGTILGRTSEGSPNSFLCSMEEFDNFELTFEVKVDDELNSGVQIRSSVCAKKERRVHGPQVEIATNGTAGFVYGEGLGTGWLSEEREDAKKNAAFKKGQWNKYRVLARGEHIQTWVNGVQIADLKETKTGMKKGFIGLQVHGVGQGKGPFEVQWREIKIRKIAAD